MVKQMFFLVTLLFTLTSAASEKNTTKIKTSLSSMSKESEVELRIYTLEHKLQAIAQSQLNYRIEKDLLKETYSRNFERINILITIVLGIFTFIGFSGIRSINTIKKEYIEELADLESTKNKFEQHHIDFERERKKITSDLNLIFEENKQQNKQINFLELKEKVGTLIKNNDVILAIEYANTALEIHPSDCLILNHKSVALMRLGKFKEASEVLQFCYDENPDDKNTLMNLAESYYFSGNIIKAKKIISENKEIFDSEENGKILEMFELFELFHDSQNQKLKDIAKSYVTYENMNKKVNRIGFGWELSETHCFAHFVKEPELKVIISNILFYWDEKLSGRDLLLNLGLDLPQKSAEVKLTFGTN